MTIKKIWTIKEWQIAVEADSEFDAVIKITNALEDVAKNIKDGKSLSELLTLKLVDLDELTKFKVNSNEFNINCNGSKKIN